MAKKKYYAVRVGRVPGIYNSWDECKAQTNAYPRAEYKSFSTLSEAQAFISSIVKPELQNIIDIDQHVMEGLAQGRVAAFTDGSYSSNFPKAGYGCYIIAPDGTPTEISDIVHTDRFVKSRNIAPEVFAVLEALKWVVANSFDKVTVYHDLENIGKWANGTYAAKSDIARLFVKELRTKFNDILDIEYVWVKGHSNIEYNEKADKLAKNAMNQAKPVGKYGPNFFSGKGVSEEKVTEIIENFKLDTDLVYGYDVLPNGAKKHIFERSGEKLTVTYFENTGTTLLQGEVRALFSGFLSLYTAYLPTFDMFRAYSDVYKQNIIDESINNKINALSLPIDYPDNAKTLLKQAFLMCELKRSEYDFTHYLAPAYRALEGHVKYLFSKAGVRVDNNNHIGSHFERESSGIWKVKSKSLKNRVFTPNLDLAYNLLYSKRHPSFHFGGIVGTYDDTLLINTLSDAVDRINEVMDVIRCCVYV